MLTHSQHTLGTIWGHEAIKRLVRAMLSDNRLPHALMLHGPDGVGKRSLAFAIAKLILSSGLNVRERSIAAPAARFAWRAGGVQRDPDDDLFGGMDDMFGGAEEPKKDEGGGMEDEESRAAAPAPEPPKKKTAAKKKAKSDAVAEPVEQAAAVAAPAAVPVALPAPSRRPRTAPSEWIPMSVDARVDRQVAKSYPIQWQDEMPLPTGHVDLNVIEPMPKAKSIKVDQVRMLQEAAWISPMEGKYRVILVFGADTITGSAANSLLKFLEEPPSYLVLILVTDHYHRILETIRSRCASLVCQPLDRAELQHRLVQEERIESGLAGVASAYAEGRPGVALQVLNGKLLEQRKEIFDARLAIDRIGPAALPLAVHRALNAAGGIGPASQMLLALVRDRMVNRLAPGAEELLVNRDLKPMLDEGSADPADLYGEAERLLESLRMEDHPAVPAPQPSLELALWPRAVALLALLCVPLAGVRAAEDDFSRNLRMTDVEVTQTSGTLVLKHIKARAATVAPDGSSVVSTDVVIGITNDETGETMELHSPYSRYYFDGADLSGAPAPETSPSEDELLAWKAAIDASTGESGPEIPDPAKGDILLMDPVGGKPLEVEIGADGKLRCANLFWSERYRRFVSIGPFEQDVEQDGGRLRSTGGMFIASQDFKTFEYPVLDGDTPFTLSWKAAP